METCLAGADEWRGGDGPLVLERGPGHEPALRRVLRGGAAGGLPADRRRERLPAGGLRHVRPHDPPRPPLERRPRVPASGDGPAEPRGAVPPLRDARRLRGNAGGRRRGRGPRGGARRRGDPLRRRDQLAAAPAALRASATPPSSRRSAFEVVHDLPGVGENLQDHLEVYVQHASKQPVSIAPALKWRNRPLVGLRWLLFRSGPAATNHFEAGGFIRSNDDVAYPNLMFHFLPLAIRYDGSAPKGPRLPGARRADVLRRARLGEDRLDRSAGAPGAALQLPVHRPGPARMGRGDSAVRGRSSSSRRSSRSTRASSHRARRSERRGDPRLGGAGRRDGAPSLLHVPHGDRRAVGRRSRRRCASTASRGCASSTRPSSPT